MKKLLVLAGLAVALAAPTRSTQAQDAPDLSSYTALGTQFFLGAGETGFQVQFLFGRQSLASSLFYQVNGDASWTKLFNTVGDFPNETTNPLPGSIFNSGAIAPTVGSREVTFALCSGLGATFGDCQAPGPFYTGVVAPNVRALTAANWSTARAGVYGVESSFQSVFGFEDKDLDVADKDWNDVVFSTNLTTVPEPSTVILMAAGLAGLVVAGRKRRVS